MDTKVRLLSRIWIEWLAGVSGFSKGKCFETMTEITISFGDKHIKHMYVKFSGEVFDTSNMLSI